MRDEWHQQSADTGHHDHISNKENRNMFPSVGYGKTNYAALVQYDLNSLLFVVGDRLVVNTLRLVR
jgi:hypothetical protein